MTEDARAGQTDGAAADDFDADHMKKALKALRREVILQRWLLVLGLAAVLGYLAIPRSVVEQVGPMIGLEVSPAVVAQANAVEFGTYSRKGERIILQNDDKWGLPTVFFFDLKRTCKLAFRVAPEGGGTPIVELYDANGPRVALSLDANNASSVRLFGKEHKGGIALSVTEDGTPSLIMSKPSGEVILALPEGTDTTKPEDDSNSSQSHRPSR